MIQTIHKFYSILILLSFINLSIQKDSIQIPIRIDTCTYKLNDGKIIDLKKLDRPLNPREFIKSPFTYNYNPCSPISCGPTTTSVICQYLTSNKLESYNLGDQNSVKYSYDNAKLTMIFTAMQGGFTRESNLDCICDKSSESFTFLREDQSSLNIKYYHEFRSECCCPDGCKSGPTPAGNSGGLSGGWILIIIAICLSAVYLIGGMLYMAMVKKNSGIQIVPNLTFWSELPGNIKAGFTFVIGKLKGGSGGYQSV